MHPRPALALALILMTLAWNNHSIAAEFHGHRGARGLAPENTMPAFEKALALGVDCLELDIGMSRDGKLVISHDPLLNPDIVRRDGQWISERTALSELAWAQIARLDVGRLNPDSRYARRYPQQAARDGTRMPLLDELLTLPALRGTGTVCLNIEIKTNPLLPEQTHSPEVIADKLLEQITAAGLRDRLIVQSFDWRSLVHLRGKAPDLRLSFLTAERSWLNNVQRGQPGPSAWLAGKDIEDFDGSIPRLIKSLGGTHWSPYYRDLRKETLDEAHALGLKVVVWTVNKIEEMHELLAMGVDGIITDYPDRIQAVMKVKQ